VSSEERYPQYSEFLVACCDSHSKAEYLLRTHPELLEARTSIGETILHYLVVEDQEEAVKFLIRHGANVNARDRSDETPLTSAAESGLVEMADLLLAAGADPNAGGLWWRTPLLAAAMNERLTVELAALLLDKGAQIDARDVTESTPLMHAVKAGNTDVVQLLLERGADASIRHDPDGTVLHVAAASERCGGEMVSLLLKAGVDPRVTNRKGETPYEVAVGRGNVVAADVLAKAYGEGQVC
jgi:ankyrin repeat protein